jgi:hypothetical protein
MRVSDAKLAEMWDIYPRPEAVFAGHEVQAKFARSQFSDIRLLPYPTWDLNRLAVYPDLVDAAELDGPTKAASLQHTADAPLHPRERPFGELFDKEISVTGPAGSDYWNAQTLAGVAPRYPGIDLTPYGG